MTRIPGPLPLTWETRNELPAPGSPACPAPTAAGIRGVRSVDRSSLSLSVSDFQMKKQHFFCIKKGQSLDAEWIHQNPKPAKNFKSISNPEKCWSDN